MLTVQHIAQSIEEIAPLDRAEAWDNCGLLLGDSLAPVKKVLVALDVDIGVLREAAENECQLIVSHHPLIFKPINRILSFSPSGQLLITAINLQLNIYSAHTNFDSAPLGISSYLAEKIGLKEITVLKPDGRTSYVKMVVFIPPDYLEEVFEALTYGGGGSIGPYDKCSFRVNGEGTFLPLAGAAPFKGEVGKLEIASETRLEMILPKNNLAAVINSMKQVHPYEAPAYDLYPLLNKDEEVGIGRLGTLSNPLPIFEIVKLIKENLRISSVRISTDANQVIEKIAVVSGSGASLITEAARQNAQLLITGDVKYHDYQLAESLGITLIDIGHYFSEAPFIDCMAKILKEKWPEQLTVVKYKGGKPPYQGV